MKKFLDEFKKFALRGNVLDMAVGIIIGAAFSGIVTSLTDNFINPILNFIMGAQTYTLSDISGFGANFLTAVINFIITAFILFCLMRAINALMTLGKKEVEPEKPATKTCPFCKSTDVPIDATRCPHCTSMLTDVSKKD